MAMVKRVSVVVVLVLAAGGVGVRGADVAATGTGKMLPAGAVADYSSPKKTVGTFLNAVQSTDERAIKEALDVPAEYEEAVDNYVKLILATNKLQKAAEGRFGEQADQYFGVNAKQMEARLKAVEGAEVKMVGESAIIEIPADETTKQPGGTIVLKKMGNDWKLDAGTLFKLSETPKEQTERGMALSKKMIPLTEQMTTEIAGGKFASAGEAYQAFWQRSLAVVKETAGGAATRPAAQGK
jgi:hypothetical protein